MNGIPVCKRCFQKMIEKQVTTRSGYLVHWKSFDVLHIFCDSAIFHVPHACALLLISKNEIQSDAFATFFCCQKLLSKQGKYGLASASSDKYVFPDWVCLLQGYWPFPYVRTLNMILLKRSCYMVVQVQKTTTEKKKSGASNVSALLSCISLEPETRSCCEFEALVVEALEGFSFQMPVRACLWRNC